MALDVEKGCCTPYCPSKETLIDAFLAFITGWWNAGGATGAAFSLSYVLTQLKILPPTWLLESLPAAPVLGLVATVIPEGYKTYTSAQMRADTLALQKYLEYLSKPAAQAEDLEDQQDERAHLIINIGPDLENILRILASPFGPYQDYPHLISAANVAGTAVTGVFSVGSGFGPLLLRGALDPELWTWLSSPVFTIGAVTIGIGAVILATYLVWQQHQAKDTALLEERLAVLKALVQYFDEHTAAANEDAETAQIRSQVSELKPCIDGVNQARALVSSILAKQAEEAHGCCAPLLEVVCRP